jgi:SAM-dependent methyltransferase
VRECLSEPAGLVRVLDFGIGSMGLYRALEDDLMRRIEVTGISESPQHDPADPLLARHAIEIAVGPGLSPLTWVADGSQDRVVCSYVFDYLSDPMRAEALRAFARVLAGGGKLLLVLHHPRGRRADKFRRSRPYWPMARALYERLSSGRHAEASALLEELTVLLNASFGNDDRYRGYLASYLKTAELFLSEFCVDGRVDGPVPGAALIDCERTACLIDRELAMTCEALRPIEHPASDLALPSELALCDLVECIDPTDGWPIAHVLTAIRLPRCNGV